MKTFEERYTAWVDGLLSADEKTLFEREYPDLVGERDEIGKLRMLLNERGRAPELQNADFFNSQLLTQIESEAQKRAPAAAVSRNPRRWLGLPRLVWAGLGSALAAACLLFLSFLPHQRSAKDQDYVAEVLKAQSNAPGVKATVDAKKDVTIIKLDGLEKVPPDKELK